MDAAEMPTKILLPTAQKNWPDDQTGHEFSTRKLIRVARACPDLIDANADLMNPHLPPIENKCSSALYQQNQSKK